jgi:2-polyprenyl-6-methoxyphenol hydroxylase-like FAD-dependent oxidoreductase
MNVVVVGSGIAGKTVAAFLRRLNVVKKVTIVQERSMNEENHNKHLTTGLWGPALACFHELGLSEALLPLLQPVGPSGYKSVGGAWLARPVVEAPLAFINNDALLRTLDDHLCLPGDVEIEVYRGRAEGLDEVHPDATTVALTTSCATAPSDNQRDRHHAHLIVAADGLHSTIRTLLLDFRQEPSPVRYRGYRVYRGHAAAGPTGQRVASEAFQVCI